MTLLGVVGGGLIGVGGGVIGVGVGVGGGVGGLLTVTARLRSKN